MLSPSPVPIAIRVRASTSAPVSICRSLPATPSRCATCTTTAAKQEMASASLLSPHRRTTAQPPDRASNSSDTQVLGANAMNETLCQYSHNTSSQTAQSTDPAILVQGAFLGGGNTLGQVSDTQNRFEFQNNTSIVHGTHSIKFGTRLRNTGDTNSSTTGFNGTFTFATLADYEALASRPITA